jgi:hypothetical protein
MFSNGFCGHCQSDLGRHRFSSLHARLISTHKQSNLILAIQERRLDGSLGQFVDTLPPLASDHLFPQRDLSIRTCHGQDVACEGPRDSPYGIGEEGVRVIGPVRQEFGRGPCGGWGRSEVDLDGSVLCRTAPRWKDRLLGSVM